MCVGIHGKLLYCEWIGLLHSPRETIQWSGAALSCQHTFFLQEYVRARLIQFAGPFARKLNPKLSPQEVQQAAQEAVASLPSADNGRIALESRDLQLVFRHDCLYGPLPFLCHASDSMMSNYSLDIGLRRFRASPGAC